MSQHPQDTATIYVVDDDEAIRNSLRMVIDSAGLPVQTYASAEAFLNDYPPDAPGCLVLDLSMPGMSGMELLRHLRAQNVHLPVLIVSGTASVTSAVEAMKLGVVDFMEKPSDPRILIVKVQDALAKDAARRTSAVEVESIRGRMAGLTHRETELLHLVISGMSNKQIADEMGISIKTVANHRAHLMDKTGAVNAADLVRLSMLAGLR